MVERGGPWRARGQAVVALAAALATTRQVEQVLGGESRYWWGRLCALSVEDVQTLSLPSVAVRAVKRWLRFRPYSRSAPWVALPGSPVQGRDARERLAMAAAREAWRVCGQAMRPAALLRWRGVAPDELKYGARRRRLWAG